MCAIISAVLIVIGVRSQVIGHQVFERRQPALMDNPSHLLLGPMFVMAKLFIALGFRHDLDVDSPAKFRNATPRGSLPYPEERQASRTPHS